MFDDLYNEITHLSSSGDIPKSIILDVLLKVAFGRPLGINLCRFGSILGSLGKAIWLQNGIQRPSPKNVRKNMF